MEYFIAGVIVTLIVILCALLVVGIAYQSGR